MNVQLFSVDQAPASLPVWETILDDLSRPSRVARTLGVGQSTVYRWNAAGGAPRIACLALFWLTRWGRSAIHTQATNDALMAVALVRGLQDELQRTRLQLQHVLELVNTGAANQPLREVVNAPSRLR